MIDMILEIYNIPLVKIVLGIVAILMPLVLAVAYTTYAERKFIGFMQVRIGPNRVGPRGWFQPFADVFKLIFKEVIVPAGANKAMFLVAPVMLFGPSIAAWAVVPFDVGLVLADVNAAVLYIIAMTSIGVYGVILAGWASNSKYAFLGALRSASQVISYELAMSFTLVAVILSANSLSLGDIVAKQEGGIWMWYWVPLFPMMLVYYISGVAETNRAPFDLPEGESEIVAGFHVEYSGTSFAVFFLAEYANMILISVLTALFFMGGWLSPFQGTPIESLFAWVPGIFWLLGKAFIWLFGMLWLRATFPRYRYDQIMRLGWKVLIPVTLVWLVVVAIMAKTGFGPWY